MWLLFYYQPYNGFFTSMKQTPSSHHWAFYRASIAAWGFSIGTPQCFGWNHGAARLCSPGPWGAWCSNGLHPKGGLVWELNVIAGVKTPQIIDDFAEHKKESLECRHIMCPDSWAFKLSVFHKSCVLVEKQVSTRVWLAIQIHVQFCNRKHIQAKQADLKPRPQKTNQ